MFSAVPDVRWILHVDIDAFFASAEQVLHPELAGKPVIVGGDPDERSVVASASYEARKFGVRSAMPLAQARRLCPHAVFLKGNFHEYSRMSEQMRGVFYSFTPDMEMGSLDEAYLDLTGCRLIYRDPFETAERIKVAVKSATGLNVSIGVSTSKLLAKIASDYAKPNGIACVWPGYEAAFLRPLDLKELPGVGPRTLERLQRYNLHRIADLQGLPQKTLSAALGPAGDALFERAFGLDGAPVEEALYPKSISRETTFDEDTADRRVMEAMLSYLAERAANKLRSIEMRAKTVSVKLRYGDFSTYHMAKSLKDPSTHDSDFRAAAIELFDKLFTRRLRVRLVGVALSNLTPELAHQKSLFEEERFLKKERLYRGIDSVRERFGFSSLFTGRAVELLKVLNRDENGFILRTPSLTQ
jgi:DNA polymerase-4